MVYYPFFRGKRFELLTIRDSSDIMAAAGFVPIIEPVNTNFSDLIQVLEVLGKANCESILILNSRHGQKRPSVKEVRQFLKDNTGLASVRPAWVLGPDSTLGEAREFLRDHKDTNITFVHSGFTHAKALGQELVTFDGDVVHIFESVSADKHYRRNFSDSKHISIGDGFIRVKNADYGPIDSFSAQHLIFAEEGFDGFGDYLIVGDGYTDGGGAAYAVAIHMTCIVTTDDDRMHVRHFVSDDNETQADPGRKFLQAVQKLVVFADSPDNDMQETRGLHSFRSYHAQAHYPGLGQVKRLSMNHHIETLARHLGP